MLDLQVHGRTRESHAAPETALRFQILSAEYGHLTSMLTNTWFTAGTRTNLFFVAVSASGVALALIANRTHATTTFLVLELAVLLLILCMGLAALARLLHANREAILYEQSLSRIRHFFIEIDPGAAAYMTLPTSDDAVGLFGEVRPASSFGVMTQKPAASMASLVALIAAFDTAAVVGTVGLLLGGGYELGAMIAAGISLVIAIVFFEGCVYLDVRRMRRSLDVRFPSSPMTGQALRPHRA